MTSYFGIADFPPALLILSSIVGIALILLQVLLGKFRPGGNSGIALLWIGCAVWFFFRYILDFPRITSLIYLIVLIVSTGIWWHYAVRGKTGRANP